MEWTRAFRAFVVIACLVTYVPAYPKAGDDRDGYGEPRKDLRDGSIPQRKGYLRYCWDIAKFFATGNYFNRHLMERNPNILSDHEFLDQARFADEYGLISSRFIPELDTRVYFSATGTPSPEGEVPLVDPKAKALFIYFHGTGTENGSGANFNYKANKLAKMGYATLAFDYPFHQQGSHNPLTAFANRWMSDINKMIEKVRVPGQPIYLVGHSFGVDAISEYITRYPKSVSGALLMSPGGVTPELMKWAQEKTYPMLRTFPHFEFNEGGSRWAGLMRKGFTWNQLDKRKLPDPTVVNPDLKVRVVTGAWEEYVPGPLKEDGLPAHEPRTYDLVGKMKEFFKNADGHVEPGVGHLIFKHNDAEGRDMVIREILGMAGADYADINKMSHETGKRFNRPFHERLLLSYQTDPFFRQFVDERYSKFQITVLQNRKDEPSAKLLFDQYRVFKAYREELLFKNIFATKEWAPEFYEANKEAIDNYDKSKRDVLLARYFDFLASAPPHIASRAVIPKEALQNIPNFPEGDLKPPHLGLVSPKPVKPAGTADRDRTDIILSEIKVVAEMSPEWYEANKASVDAVREGGEQGERARGRLFAAFFKYKKAQTPERQKEIETRAAEAGE
jgi:pimeloyl-ACP methyl ester carboxylesterase